MEEIFETFMTAINEELKGAADKLKDMTPSPMNTMLEKESHSSAVKKKIDESNKITENVPPYHTRYQQPQSNRFLVLLFIVYCLHVYHINNWSLSSVSITTPRQFRKDPIYMYG